MPLPTIPRLERFCVCLDVHTGVKYFSLGLMVLWIVYTLAAIFGAGNIGNIIWAIIWCAATVVCYGLVILAMQKSNKLYMFPALIISVFNIIVGAIQAVIAFVSLWIFSAIVILIITAITTYYALGLKTVYDDLSTGGPPPAEPADKSQTVNPV
eukprot:GFUD01006849.1.p1 GENE.GFUD01006849.1~~GFUD01006849.1.p1  ORF type:complete len:154 (-),score=37.54 GFUD01006849.1:211-672(-)